MSKFLRVTTGILFLLGTLSQMGFVAHAQSASLAPKSLYAPKVDEGGTDPLMLVEGTTESSTGQEFASSQDSPQFASEQTFGSGFGIPLMGNGASGNAGYLSAPSKAGKPQKDEGSTDGPRKPPSVGTS